MQCGDENYKHEGTLIRIWMGELNQSANRHVVVEILCGEQKISADDLGPTETMKTIADGKEKILGMQLIMNDNCDWHPDQRL